MAQQKRKADSEREKPDKKSKVVDEKSSPAISSTEGVTIIKGIAYPIHIYKALKFARPGFSLLRYIDKLTRAGVADDYQENLKQVSKLPEDFFVDLTPEEKAHCLILILAPNPRTAGNFNHLLGVYKNLRAWNIPSQFLAVLVHYYQGAKILIALDHLTDHLKHKVPSYTKEFFVSALNLTSELIYKNYPNFQDAVDHLLEIVTDAAVTRTVTKKVSLREFLNTLINTVDNQLQKKKIPIFKLPLEKQNLSPTLLATFLAAKISMETLDEIPEQEVEKMSLEELGTLSVKKLQKKITALIPSNNQDKEAKSTNPLGIAPYSQSYSQSQLAAQSLVGLLSSPTPRPMPPPSTAPLTSLENLFSLEPAEAEKADDSFFDDLEPLEQSSQLTV